jgi:CBS domain-containing protein
MRAMDVMTTEVISVDPDASVQALAALLSERGISWVPLSMPTIEWWHRQRGRPVAPRRNRDRAAARGSGGAPAIMVARPDRELARGYVKSHGHTVKDIMTRDVAAVSDTTELADLAILLETKRIKRVPLVRDGRLVGIAGRANLVRALATTMSAPGDRRRSWRPRDSTTSSSPSCGERSGWIFRRRTSSCAIGSCISGSPTTSRGRRG